MKRSHELILVYFFYLFYIISSFIVILISNYAIFLAIISYFLSWFKIISVFLPIHRVLGYDSFPLRTRAVLLSFVINAYIYMVLRYLRDENADYVPFWMRDGSRDSDQRPLLIFFGFFYLAFILFLESYLTAIFSFSGLKSLFLLIVSLIFLFCFMFHESNTRYFSRFRINFNLRKLRLTI